MFNQMARIEAVIFDLDGTLIDSAPDLQHATNRLMRELGQPEFDLATISGFIGNGVRKLVERAMTRNGMDLAALDAHTERFKVIYEEAPADRTIVFEGVREALSQLQARGLRLAVCTNKPERAAAMILDALGLAPYFDVLIGGDTTAALKPDPLPLQEAMRRLGIGAEATAFVGDSITDAKTAEAAALPFIFYEGGYNHHGAGKIDSIAQFTDYDSLPQLIANSIVNTN